MLTFKATKGLKINFIFALIGNVGYAAFQFLLLTIFVHFYSTEEVGVFNYVGAFVLPITLAFDLQLRSLYITGTEVGHFHSYHVFRNWMNVAALIVLIASTQFIDPRFFWFVIILGLMKLLENQANLYYGLFHKVESLKRVATSRWIKTGGTFAIVAVSAIVFRPNFLTLLWIYLAAHALLFMVIDFRWMLNLSKGLPSVPIAMKKLLWLTFPMIIIALIEKYYINFPKLALEKYFGLEIIGIVGTLYYFRMIGSQIVMSLSTATQARYGDLVAAKNYKSLDKFVFLNAGIGAGLGLGLLVVFLLFGEWIIGMLFNEAYTAYMDALYLILIGAAASFAYTFFGGVFNSLRIHQWKVLFQGSSFVFLGIMTYFFHETVNELLINVIYAEVLTLLQFIGTYVLLRRKFQA